MLFEKNARFGVRRTMVRLGMGAAAVLIAAATGAAAPDNERNDAVSVVEEFRLMSAQTIVAVDGQSQVTVPDGWGMAPRDVWGKGETLQVADSRGSGNLMIAPQAGRGDFATFAQNVRANLVSGRVIRTSHVSEGRPLSIAGRAAVQWEAGITNNGVDAVGWMTAVEGERSYYLVFAWTSPARLAEDAETIQDIVLSFRELP